MIITKVVNSRVLRLALLFFLILSCNPEGTEELDRQRSIRQREQNKQTIRTTRTQDIFGRYNSSDYDGPTCEDAKGDDKNIGRESCEDICDVLFDQASDKCEELALELIEKLSKLFKDMLHLGNEENLSRSVNNFDFGVMIDIDVQPVLNLIDGWNVRETAEFLIWMAKTSQITLALEAHDREHKILKSAFEAVSDGTVEEGLAKDLKGYGKTFWVLARKENNKSAFIVAHSLLQELCSSKNCKLKNYCIREEFEENSRNRTACPYSDDRRSFRREKHCYIHGPDVWSFWLNLNRDGDFDDSDFPANAKLNEEECNNLCKTENCNRDSL